jgi:hypothetical protein
LHLPAKRSNALSLIAFFNPFIFAVSYFAFPAHQNVNCIHEACFPGLDDWTGPIYSVLFWLAIFLVHLILGRQFERFFSRTELTAEKTRLVRRAAVAVFTACLALAAWDTRYKLSLPQFRCVNGPQTPPVQTTCRFTLDFEPEKMLLAYRVKNASAVNQLCTTTLVLEGIEIALETDVRLAASETRNIRSEVPYPNQSVTASLAAHCIPDSGEPRSKASLPR